MDIQPVCPHCGVKYSRIPAVHAGKTTHCRKCGSAFTIQGTQEPALGPHPARREWQVGDIILDRYQVKAVLGAGAMGRVYRVHHKQWHSDLAVKSPLPELIDNPRAVENFIREAETWVKLGLHPYTVSCYYVRTIDGIPRVFVECVEGGSLADWIRQRKLYAGGPAKALQRILDIAIQFAWGLDYSHQQGLIHQDVKPANVMMSPDGVTKVTDFGLANAIGTASVASADGTVMATGGGMTPAYCSPEQAELSAKRKAGATTAELSKLTRRTDIWSWAVSVLEMFTGGVTWPMGNVAHESLVAYRQQPPDDERLPPMPDALAEQLQACLQLHPEQRPPDLKTVAQALVELYPSLTGAAYPREWPKAGDYLADSLNNQAVSLWELGRDDQAMAQCEQAIQADPVHPQAIYNRALQQWRARTIDDTEVLQRLENCAGHPSTAQTAHYLIGQIQLERRDHSAAVAALRASDHLDDSDTLLESIRAHPWAAMTFEGHRRYVVAIAVSRDGRRILSGGRDAFIRLWDAQTARCLQTIETQSGFPDAVALSANARVGLVSNGNKIRLWELKSGSSLGTFDGHTNSVQSLCLDPSGDRLLSGSEDHSLRLWNIPTATCIREFHGHREAVQTVAFSPDGRYALSGACAAIGAGEDHSIRIWDLDSGECLRVLDGHAGNNSLGLPEAGVRSAYFSADGRQILSGGDDGCVRLWDVATGKCLRDFSAHGDQGVQSLDWSPDGRYALTGSWDATVKLWDVADGRCLCSFRDHRTRVNTVAFGPDGAYALSGSEDNRLILRPLSAGYDAPPALVRIKTSETMLATGSEYRQRIDAARTALQQGQAEQALTALREARADPDHARAADAIALWTQLYRRLPRKGLQTVWQEKSWPGHVGGALVISADGRTALSAGQQKIDVWDLDSQRCVHTLSGHTQDIHALALSRDGQTALSGSGNVANTGTRDNSLRLWSLADGRCVRVFNEFDAPVNAVVIHRDARLAWTGDGGRLRLWDLKTGACLRDISGDKSIDALALSPDEQHLLSGGRDGHIKLWDVAGGHCIKDLAGHRDDIESLAFDSIGRLAVSGSMDGTCRLWEVATGRCLRVLEGHQGKVVSSMFDLNESAVSAVAFSPDGRYVLSGSWDRSIKLWEVATGECIRTLKGHPHYVNTATFSPDGAHILSGDAEGGLRWWFLDWKLEPSAADWDPGADPYLSTFLHQHTPSLAPLPERQPSADQLRRHLTRHGRPDWNKDDLGELLRTLGNAGYGWLKPDRVSAKLRDRGTNPGAAPQTPPTAKTDATAADAAASGKCYVLWHMPCSHAQDILLNCADVQQAGPYVLKAKQRGVCKTCGRKLEQLSLIEATGGKQEQVCRADPDAIDVRQQAQHPGSGSGSDAPTPAKVPAATSTPTPKPTPKPIPKPAATPAPTRPAAATTPVSAPTDPVAAISDRQAAEQLTTLAAEASLLMPQAQGHAVAELKTIGDNLTAFSQALKAGTHSRNTIGRSIGRLLRATFKDDRWLTPVLTLGKLDSGKLMAFEQDCEALMRRLLGQPASSSGPIPGGRDAGTINIQPRAIRQPGQIYPTPAPSFSEAMSPKAATKPPAAAADESLIACPHCYKNVSGHCPTCDIQVDRFIDALNCSRPDRQNARRALKLMATFNQAWDKTSKLVKLSTRESPLEQAAGTLGALVFFIVWYFSEWYWGFLWAGVIVGIGQLIATMDTRNKAIRASKGFLPMVRDQLARDHSGLGQATLKFWVAHGDDDTVRKTLDTELGALWDPPGKRISLTDEFSESLERFHMASQEHFIERIKKDVIADDPPPDVTPISPVAEQRSKPGGEQPAELLADAVRQLRELARGGVGNTDVKNRFTQMADAWDGLLRSIHTGEPVSYAIQVRTDALQLRAMTKQNQLPADRLQAVIGLCHRVSDRLIPNPNDANASMTLGTLLLQQANTLDAVFRQPENAFPPASATGGMEFGSVLQLTVSVLQLNGQALMQQNQGLDTRQAGNAIINSCNTLSDGNGLAIVVNSFPSNAGNALSALWAATAIGEVIADAPGNPMIGSVPSNAYSP